MRSRITICAVGSEYALNGPANIKNPLLYSVKGTGSGACQREKDQWRRVNDLRVRHCVSQTTQCPACLQAPGAVSVHNNAGHALAGQDIQLPDIFYDLARKSRAKRSYFFCCGIRDFVILSPGPTLSKSGTKSGIGSNIVESVGSNRQGSEDQQALSEALAKFFCVSPLPRCRLLSGRGWLAEAGRALVCPALPSSDDLRATVALLARAAVCA